MGVITIDGYIRTKFASSVRYYKLGVQIPGQFKVFALDGNPLIYGAAMKAFEFGDYDTTIRENDHLSYDEKIQLTFQYVWDEINNLLSLIDCETFYLAIDGSAPLAKMAQQRKRRYPRSPAPTGDFDSTLISCGTQFMNDLCLFLSFKIQKEWVKESIKKFILSPASCPGEGEHKAMKYLRSFPPKTRVILMSPDGDLMLLGLLTNLDFFLFKVDHTTRAGYDKQYYTVRMNSIKPLIQKETPKMHIIDATKSFVFLASLLGNDFCPKLEALQVFRNGFDDMYLRFRQLGKPLIANGRLDKLVFSDLLYFLAREETSLLEKRTDHPFPLLEKHLTGGKLHFENFRKEYYSSWLKITDEKDIALLCYNYLDVLFFVWVYYNRATPPDWNFYYKYHYPPFLADLAKYSQTWKIPNFRQNAPRTPFQQLVAIFPPSRKGLLPEEYHHLFQGPEFPDANEIITNTQGRSEFETVYELPVYDKPITVVDKEHYNRNEIGQDRIFTKGTTEYWVITKWEEFSTKIQG
jgi:5'-3' exonuclease